MGDRRAPRAYRAHAPLVGPAATCRPVSVLPNMLAARPQASPVMPFTAAAALEFAAHLIERRMTRPDRRLALPRRHLAAARESRAMNVRRPPRDRPMASF